jgi:hypothetical protein
MPCSRHSARATLGATGLDDLLSVARRAASADLHHRSLVLSFSASWLDAMCQCRERLLSPQLYDISRPPLRLSCTEREEISRGLVGGESLQAIARRLDRALTDRVGGTSSTVSPAATSCWASRAPSPPARVRGWNGAGKPSWWPAWRRPASIRSSTTACSPSSMAAAVWEPPCVGRSR